MRKLKYIDAYNEAHKIWEEKGLMGYASLFEILFDVTTKFYEKKNAKLQDKVDYWRDAHRGCDISRSKLMKNIEKAIQLEKKCQLSQNDASAEDIIKILGG
jgi:hypothetical protein